MATARVSLRILYDKRLLRSNRFLNNRIALQCKAQTQRAGLPRDIGMESDHFQIIPVRVQQGDTGVANRENFG